mgnify:CR=1 FL=1
MIALFGYKVSYRNKKLAKRGIIVSNNILNAGLEVQSKQPKKLLEKYGRYRCDVRMLLKIIY